MTIPDYQSIMLPLLKYAGDQQEHSRHEAIEHISKIFELSEAEKNQLLPSGTKPTINNRVGWAKTYLKKAGLLEYPKRGYLKITELGLSVLQDKPEKINNRYLQTFPEFLKFRKTSTVKKEDMDIEEEKTPLELIEKGVQQINIELGDELLEYIKKSSPAFFERLVVNLLVRMGYGGSILDAGRALGRVGDEGVDGVIKEDKLGLDNIYIQAKRWNSSVGRPELQAFVGALQGKRSKKGIFITTSTFTDAVKDYVNSIETKVALIDGVTLVQYMIENELGVLTRDTYKIKELDIDYFEEID
ncbi:restriction endonuclease [Candidatus Bathyarchaeota archaeon]|nr:restriction endonuclease [Candidatus Bathyarchaeota archaeon]